MSNCCFDGKGWRLVTARISDRNNSFDWRDKYNVTVENTGDVDLVIDNNITLAPGACKTLGIEGCPCAETAKIEWDENQSGTKTATITAYAIVAHQCCEK